MQYSIVNKSKLHGNLRIDAEFYSPDFLQLEKTLNSHKTEVFSTYSFFVKKGIFDLSPDFYREQGIPLIRTSEIKDPQIDFSTTVFLDEKTQSLNRKTELASGDIVFTKIGAYIGDVAMLPNKYARYNFSQNVTGVKLKKDMIMPGFLLAYLLSKYGNGQIKRIIMLSGQGKLELKDIKNIKVVLLDEKIKALTHKIVLQAELLKEESVNIYREAEQALLFELGLLNWNPKHYLSFVKKLSDTQVAGRIDAEYFQPKFDFILKKIKCIDKFLLEDNFNILKGKNFPYISGETTGVIKTKQLKEAYIDFDVEDFTSSEIIKHSQLPCIKNGDVVFASMGVGSLGKTNIFYDFESDKKFTIDSTLRIFRKKPNAIITPECLTIYLNSLVGQTLIYQNIVGTSGIISIYEDYLKKIPVPVLREKMQLEISNNVMNAHKNRMEAIKLLNIAKRGVEIAIGKSEKEALKWIDLEVNRLGVRVN